VKLAVVVVAVVVYFSHCFCFLVVAVVAAEENPHVAVVFVFSVVVTIASSCCCCCCCCCCRYKISKNAKYCRHFVKNVSCQHFPSIRMRPLFPEFRGFCSSGVGINEKLLNENVILLASCDSFWADNKCNVIPLSSMLLRIMLTNEKKKTEIEKNEMKKEKKEKLMSFSLQRMQRQIFVNAPFLFESLRYLAVIMRLQAVHRGCSS